MQEIISWSNVVSYFVKFHFAFRLKVVRISRLAYYSGDEFWSSVSEGLDSNKANNLDKDL